MSKGNLTFRWAGRDAARSLILHLAEILIRIPRPDTRISTPTFSHSSTTTTFYELAGTC